MTIDWYKAGCCIVRYISAPSDRCRLDQLFKLTGRLVQVVELDTRF
jgi:hypothetical protein